MVTFRWGESLDCVHPPYPPQGGRGKRKGFVFTPTVPLKGEGEKEGFPQGFVKRRSIFLFGVLSNVTRKTFDCMFNRLASTSEAIDCIHPACFCLSAENVSPSRGARVCWMALCRVLSSSLKQWFVEGFVQRFSFFWQTVGHTLFIFIHIFLKSNFVIL